MRPSERDNQDERRTAGAGTEPAMTGTSLTARTVSAAQWRTATTVVRSTLQFGVTVLLSRLLPPSDFGLIALAMIFTGLARLFSHFGIAPAIIQRESLDERHIRTGFTLSSLLGLGATGALVLVSPLSAAVFNEPAVPAVLRAVAINFVFYGTSDVAGALLQRRLQFNRIFYISIVSYGVGYAGVAVILALSGFGVWSLVAGAVVQAFIEMVMKFGLAPHSRRPLFGREEGRQLLGYGFGISLDGIARFGAAKGDSFSVGRWLGAANLGLYTRAYGFMMLVQDFFGDVALSVMFPAFSHVKSEPRRFRRAYLMATEMVTLGGAPLMVGLIVAAPHLIVGLYGEAWAGATRPMQILCAFGALHAMYPLNTAVARASGDVYQLAWRTWVFALLVVSLSIIGTRWALEGVALGVGLSFMFAYLAVGSLCVRILSIGWSDLLKAQRAGWSVAVLVGAAALPTRLVMEAAGLPSLAILLGIIIACAAMSLLGIYMLPQAIRPQALFDKLVSEVSLPARGRSAVARILRVRV